MKISGTMTKSVIIAAIVLAGTIIRLVKQKPAFKILQQHYLARKYRYFMNFRLAN